MLLEAFYYRMNNTTFTCIKSGILGKDEYTNILSQFGSDTSKFTSDFIDDEVLILTGTNSKGKRVIIVDSENDNDFTGDRIIEYDYPISIERQKQIDSLLPIVSAKYDYYYNGKKITKTISIKPSPYYRSLNINLPTDNEIEKKYFLFVSVPEYRKGTLKLDDNKYNVCVSNQFSSTTYSKQNTKMFIFDPKNKIPSETDGEIPFKIGEIFNANSNDFLIQAISTWGDTLYLKYIGKNVHPLGYKEGYYVPAFTANKLDSTVFSIDQYQGKYILIDFWGTWCNPCLKLIPDLVKFNQEIDGNILVMVSVAYDNDIKKVSDFVNNNGMNWIQVFVDENETDQNSIVEKLKISNYPTLILIGPTGEILARDKSLDQIQEIINKK